MSSSRGRNAGVTGLIDLPGQSGKVQVEVYGLSTNLSQQLKTRLGRGSGRWAAFRVLLSNGMLVVRGKVKGPTQPIPSSWNGQEGTVTVQERSGKTVSIPVKIVAVEFGYNEKLPPAGGGEDEWNFTASCAVTGSPTWTGWSAAATATDATPADQQMWGEGTVKILDETKIQSGATVTIDVWGNMADTDAAEAARIASVVATAKGTITDLTTAGLAGLKVRTARFHRDSSDGGQVVIAFGLTTPAEDILNQSASTTTDPLGLQSRAAVAAWNAEPTGDAIPDAPFVKRTTTTREINDNMVLNVDEYGLRTTQQDVEMDGTYTRLDVSEIESVAQQTSVYAIPSEGPPTIPTAVIPSGLQKVSTDTRQLNPLRSAVVYGYAVDTPAQKITQQNTFTYTDASGLESRAQTAGIGAAVSTPDGFVARGVKLQPITNAKTLHVTDCGLTTTAQDREFPGTFYEVDPEDLATRGLITRVYDHGTEETPITADDPTGLEHNTTIRSSKVVKINGGMSQKSWELSRTTTAEDAVNAASSRFIDASGLRSEAVTAVVDDPVLPGELPPTPSGATFVKTGETYKTINNKNVLETYVWGLRTNEQAITMDESFVRLDAGGIEDMERIAAVNDTATPPTPDPAVSARFTAGMKVVDRKSVQLNPGKWKHTLDYGREDSADKIVNQNTFTSDDPDDLDSQQQIASFGTPTLTTGYRSRGTTTKTIAGKTLTIIKGGLRTTAEDITRPATVSIAPMDDGQIDRIATMLTDANSSPEQLAKAYFSANKSKPNFVSVTVHKENSTRAVRIVETRTNDLIVRGDVYDVPLSYFRVSGGAVQVFVADIVQVAAGWWKFLVVPKAVRRVRVEWTVRQRTTAKQLPFNLDKVGKANSDLFLNFAAGYVTYIGSPFSGNLSVPVADMNYRFMADSMGHYDDSAIIPGWNWTTTDISALTKGWVASTSVGWTVSPIERVSFRTGFGFF